MQVVNIVAVLLSPIIAVLVSIFIQNRGEKRKKKMEIFTTLLSTRHHIFITDETVQALNMIDVVFYDKPKIRKLWKDYYDVLCQTTVNPKSQQDKKLELIHEMAKELGYGKAISTFDIDRSYYPNGLLKSTQRAEEISDELLRILKSSSGLIVVPNQEQRLE